jgi:segregation and condensation protein A
MVPHDSPGSGPHDDGEENETPEPKQPVYPSGKPLSVTSDSVRVTMLDAESLERFRSLPADEGSRAAEVPEFRTPLGVKLPSFEGPLDLLLHLIRRDELDIYDIPIGHITEQYLATLGLMQVLDLDVAGEFLVMAATLMRIKARLLLPTWPDDEDEEDPRFELVQQLLEYRRFKEAAERLRVKEAEQRLRFGRGALPEAPGMEIELAPISHFMLIDVMKDVLARVGEEFFYEVEMEDVTLEEKLELVTRELAEKGRVLFVDLVARTPRRLHIVVTFMAILELARLGRLIIAQEGTFSQIWLYPGSPETEAAFEPETEPAFESETAPPGDATALSGESSDTPGAPDREETDGKR